MKVLLVMSLLQIGILLFLFGKISTIENERNTGAPVEHRQPQKDALDELQADISARMNYDGSLETQLRDIVREELAAQLFALSLPAAPEVANATAKEIDEVEYQMQRDFVAQKLDIYESVGRISELDMQDLQSEIAKLDPADRKQAFSRLVRAMNSGALEGRL